MAWAGVPEEAAQTGCSGGLLQGYTPLWGRVWGAGLGEARGGGKEAGGGGCSAGRTGGSSGGGVGGATARLAVVVVDLQRTPNPVPGAGFDPLPGPG